MEVVHLEDRDVPIRVCEGKDPTKRVRETREISILKQMIILKSSVRSNRFLVRFLRPRSRSRI